MTAFLLKCSPNILKIANAIFVQILLTTKPYLRSNLLLSMDRLTWKARGAVPKRAEKAEWGAAAHLWSELRRGDWPQTASNSGHILYPELTGTVFEDQLQQTRDGNLRGWSNSAGRLGKGLGTSSNHLEKFFASLFSTLLYIPDFLAVFYWVWIVFKSSCSPM